MEITPSGMSVGTSVQDWPPSELAKMPWSDATKTRPCESGSETLKASIRGGPTGVQLTPSSGERKSPRFVPAMRAFTGVSTNTRLLASGAEYSDHVSPASVDFAIVPRWEYRL